MNAALPFWTLILLFPMCGTPAVAQQWRVLPTARIGLLYDDNVGLEAVDSQGSFGTDFAAAVSAVRSTENTRVAAIFALGQIWYSELEDLNNTTALIGVDAGYKTARSSFRFATALETESTLTSEEATTGLSDPGGRQYRFSVTPTWLYLITERLSSDVTVTYEDVFYEGVGDGGPSDYRSGALSIRAQLALTERSSLEALVGYGRYSSAGVEGDTEALIGQIGAGYQLSETLFVNLRVGLRSSETPESASAGASDSGRSIGRTYELSLDKAFERGGGLAISASRAPAPSGGGEVQDTTRLSVRIDYPLSEHLGLAIGASGNRNRQLSDAGQASGVDFAEGNLRLNYKVFEKWWIRLGYGIKWQNDDAQPASAQATTLFLTLARQGS